MAGDSCGGRFIPWKSSRERPAVDKEQDEMSFKVSRPSAAERKVAWQMAAYHRIAHCNPETEWREISPLIDALLLTLGPASADLPDAREGWGRIMMEYERRRAVAVRVHPVQPARRS
jgi:hypothetical protein